MSAGKCHSNSLPSLLKLTTIIMSRQPQSKPFNCGAMVATSAPPYFRRFRLSEYFAEWQWPRVHSFCNTDGQTVTQCLKDHVTPKAQIQWKKQMRMLETCWGRGWPNKIQNIGRKDVNLGSTTIRQKIRHLTEKPVYYRSQLVACDSWQLR